MSASEVKIVLLDGCQLLMMFAGMLTYFEPNLFPLIIFYKGPCVILKHYLCATCMCVPTYIVSRHVMAGASELLNFIIVQAPCFGLVGLALFV
jgi:hypothetical protein